MVCAKESKTAEVAMLVKFGANVNAVAKVRFFIFTFLKNHPRLSSLKVAPYKPTYS
jgi:hypothetical protein